MRRDLDLSELWQSSVPMASLRDPRRSVMLHATVSVGDGPVLAARVRNISAGGVMAECRAKGAEGERVHLSLRGLAELGGTIAWIQRDRMGVMFDEPIDTDELMRRPQASLPRSYTPRAAERAWRPALHCS